MLLLPDAWTWDCWFLEHGGETHAFYLKASRALLDPERRHLHAAIGHAVSADLRTWRELPDALVPADEDDAFDRVAIWTGSVVPDPAGGWRLFYTGRSAAAPVERQRIGSARSDDLITWHRDGAAVLEADGRWYEKWGDPAGSEPGWGDEAWRDPWVFPDPDGARWHMLVTARGRTAPVHDRGVLGHAVSTDLRAWTVTESWSAEGSGFAQLEVPQLVEVDGRWAVVFSCLPAELAPARRSRTPSAGMWAAPVDSPLGPYDLSRAEPLTGSELYAGKVLPDPSGGASLLAFRNRDAAGEFVGGICDPIPVRWRGDRLVAEAPGATPLR